MKFSTSLVVALAVGLMAATPALAQSNRDAVKPDASAAAAKQQTSGMPVGATPEQYGIATKQRTSGMPVGATPQQYGSPEATKSQ